MGGTDAPDRPVSDAGTFRLVDALFRMDGWRLDVPRRRDHVAVDLLREDGGPFAVRTFARGASAGAAALAAWSRYRTITGAAAA